MNSQVLEATNVEIDGISYTLSTPRPQVCLLLAIRRWSYTFKYLFFLFEEFTSNVDMDFLDIHHTTVQDFSAMSRFEEWYNITAVRVLNIWSDYEHNRVLLWLLDSNRDTKIAVCPKRLEPILIQMNLRENVFALNHFQLYEFYNDHPTYHYYKISTSDRGIIFNHNTNLTRLADDFANTFPRYSLVSTVTTLADDHTKRKMLINNVLVSTALTDFAMDPYMPEAERIKERYT
ncbi:hypothetical protein LXL04_009036 [Taraxacum kok-saghyz]